MKQFFQYYFSLLFITYKINMIKKWFKYLLWLFVFWLWFINFSFAAVWSLTIDLEKWQETQRDWFTLWIDENFNFYMRNEVDDYNFWFFSIAWRNRYYSNDVVGWIDWKFYYTTSNWYFNSRNRNYAWWIPSLYCITSLDSYCEWWNLEINDNFYDLDFVWISIYDAGAQGEISSLYCLKTAENKYCFNNGSRTSVEWINLSKTMTRWDFVWKFWNSPYNSSGGGWAWQRFPINWNRPWIKWSSMVREYTNDEILSAFGLYWFDKNYSCYAWIPINWDYSWYVLWSGASIFDIVSNFYDLWYTSVSQFSDYDLEVAAKWLDYYASSVQSSVFYYSWWYDIFYWFKNGVLSNQSHWMQSLFYYWTYFWQFSSREAVDIINYCRLSLDNTLSWTWIYSWTLPDIPILNQISFDDNWNAIWFAWDFWTWESMLSALSWENIDYDFIWFASDLKDKFQNIFIWNAYHTTWIIPEYILWFLMLFLLFKFLRK